MPMGVLPKSQVLQILHQHETFPGPTREYLLNESYNFCLKKYTYRSIPEFSMIFGCKPKVDSESIFCKAEFVSFDIQNANRKALE
mmetsp:Transcript_11999/g.21731  ORF Transcript_11999/g.21731 Transcript_11999/m.21731 type:complete len:85 (+) Transcript_11999:802-1056(+)